MPDPWDDIPAPDAYENSAFIPDGPAFFPRWAAAAQAFRDETGDNARLGMVYGAHPRMAFDLFLTGDTPKGLMVFVHGGYWLRLGREFFSHLARGPLAQGWAVAMPSYPLCPDVRIAEITAAVRAAVEAAASYVPGPIVLSGHSAGGHLVLRMATDLGWPACERLKAVVSVSPLTELEPLRHLAMNQDWRIDAAEAQAESPRRHSPPAVPVELVVGAQERPVFLDQARWQAAAWPQARLTEVPGRHHFDVIDPFETLDADWLRRALA